MPRRAQPCGTKGSLKWIQILVNEHPEVIDKAIGFGPVTWISPLRPDDYAEYWDDEFLRKLGLLPPEHPLDGFWPKGGPRWDVLGRNRAGAAILIEAKAHEWEFLAATLGPGP
jgi:hypothetical protein